jgi:recombination protein RecA
VEGNAKSLFAKRVIAQAQTLFPDKACCYIDTEFTFDREWAETQGVNTSKLQFQQSNIAEQVFGWATKYAQSGGFSVIVVDSLGNLLPRKAFDLKEFYKGKGQEYETSFMPGLMAKLTTDFAKQVSKYASETNTLILVINQMRSKIGVNYGSDETTPGGHAWGHDLSLRIKLQCIDRLKDGKQNIIGMKVKATIKKSKIATTSATDDHSHLIFYFENGAAKTEAFSLYDTAIKKGIIVAKGPWYRLMLNGQEIKKWVGRDNVQNEILSNDELREQIKKGIEESSRDGTFGAEPSSIPEETLDE